MTEMLERAAAAVANGRAKRRGVEPVEHIMLVIKVAGGTLYDDLIDDSRNAIAAILEPSESMITAATRALVTKGADNIWSTTDSTTAKGVWQAMILALISEKP